MNGDQARAVLPVLRNYDRTGYAGLARMRVSFAELQKMINKLMEQVSESTERMRKVLARYDAEQQEKRRHEMIYGRLDGRRPKR